MPKVNDHETNLEVEVKAKVSDMRSFEDALIKRPLILLKEDWQGQSDIYLRHPSRDLAATDEALRVRTVGDRTILTYKGPKVDLVSKTREELEVDIEGDVIPLLQRLGFDPLMTVEKKRKTYDLDGMEICLDDVKGLGTYVEIELKGGDLERTRAKVLKTAKDLGLRDLERRSYLELLVKRSSQSK